MLQPNYEPYSSVSFQQKQRTSPYPTDNHTHNSNSYPLLKSYDLGPHPTSLGFIPWKRKRLFSRRILFVCLLGITLILFCFWQWITLYWAFFRIKLDNTLFDGGYIPCGTIRKEPMLYVQDTQHVQVVWEMNCNMKDMMIFWQPSTATTRLKRSTQQQWESQVVEPTILDDRHVLYKSVLGPLNSSTMEYQYRIETKNARRIRQYTFHWKQHATKSRIRIGALADNQFGLTTFLRILGQLRKHRPDYLLHAGDAVQNYPSLTQWQTDFVAPFTFFGLGQRNAMIYAHGNHDHDPTYEYHYTRSSTALGDPWHAFSMADGAIRFIVLDSNLDWHQQDEWLQKELASEKCQQAAFRIVVVHIPPFLEYWDPDAWFKLHQNEWGSFVRNRFVPLFEKYGVNLVISGHQHNYERGQRNQIHYAIIGGAGGDLDFDRVHDWGMYESNLLDFHFVIIDLIPISDQQQQTWKLVWNTYDKHGKLADTQIIESTTRRKIHSFDNDDDDNNNNDSDDDDDNENVVDDDDDDDDGQDTDDNHGAVEGDIIQDITLMDMDDQQQ